MTRFEFGLQAVANVDLNGCDKLSSLNIPYVCDFLSYFVSSSVRH